MTPGTTSLLMESSETVRTLIAGVRGRWRLVRAMDGWSRAAFLGSTVLVAATLASRWADRSVGGLVAIASMCGLAIVAVLAWTLIRSGDRPSDRRVARFIEERAPELDDRLATAVDLVAADRLGEPSPLLASMMADAAARARDLHPLSVIPSALVRRAGLRAGGAAVALAVAGWFAAAPARQALDAAVLLLFPGHLQLRVQPGDWRVASGAAMTIEAMLDGTRAPVDVRVEIDDGNRTRSLAMVRNEAGAFGLSFDAVTSPFTYRVLADRLASPTYSVRVARAPRVARVDLEYVYPASLGLKPRAEQDGGDIYAPAGTDVRLTIHADRPAATGWLVLADGTTRPLTVDSATLLSTALTIAADGSYRIALADREGLSSPGETEYFIRVLEDRPPDVHVTRPAADRAVTRLEEVDIDVQADDDHGIDRLELVYAVRGAGEHVVPLPVPAGATSVTARHTLSLEDLDLQQGDFVSYFVRARDTAKGRRGAGARSDIFFLEVKPYEQEFSLAMSESMAGSGNAGAIDELVNRQRQVVVATWKLDRRAENGRGARSAADVRTLAQTEADLRVRVEEAASTFRESTMRDPRRRGPVGATTTPRPEDGAMAVAAAAMGRAADALQALDTGAALPPEMEALNALLKAEADVKRRQLSTNRAGSGSDDTNRNYDLSTLFDRELRQQQQTSYETTTAERPGTASRDMVDRVKELADRQDELLGRQRSLERTDLAPPERRRELEQLTRDQTELRQRADDLERRLSAAAAGDGRPSRSANAPTSGQDPASRGPGDGRQTELRQASEAMGRAAGDLGRSAPEQAAADAGRALETLRRLERRMQSSRPDDRRRVIGDMQLEARELADSQRRIATDLGKLLKGDAARDALRRLAGEEERLAERMRRLRDDVQVTAGPPARGGTDRPDEAKALRDAVRDGGALFDRMKTAADQMRKAAPDASGRASPQRLADAIDRLAGRLRAAGGATADSERLSEQLARARELRDKLDEMGRALQTAGASAARSAGAAGGRPMPGESGRIGEGRRGAGGVDSTDLRAESLRRLQETQKLLEEIGRDDPAFSRNGAGFTFEGQGLVLSAPGSEGFKQDFDKWELLKRRATSALEQAESTLAKRLDAQVVKDRLAAGVEDKAPAAFQSQIDAYFKSLANRSPATADTGQSTLTGRRSD